MAPAFPPRVSASLAALRIVPDPPPPAPGLLHFQYRAWFPVGAGDFL